MKVTVQAEIPLDAETYLLERDGAAFRSFIAEEMSLMEYEIQDSWQEGQSTVIRLNSKPDVGAWIPGSLAKSVPDKFEYFDVVAYDPTKLQKAPYQLHVRSEVPFLGNKGQFESRIIIEPAGPGRCRHILEQTIEIKGMFGLGGVAKKLAKKSLNDSFNELPAIMDKWLKIREGLLQSRHGREKLVAGRPKIAGVPWMDEMVAATKQGKPQPRRTKSKKRPRQAAAATLGVDAHAMAGAELAPAAPEAAGQPAAGAQAAGAPKSLPGIATGGAGYGGPDPPSTPPSAFAAAAGVAAQPPAQQAQQGQLPPVPEGTEQEQEEFADASQSRPVNAARQGTGMTTYMTPTASLATNASLAEPYAPPPQLPPLPRQPAAREEADVVPGPPSPPPRDLQLGEVAGPRAVTVTRLTGPGGAPVEESDGADGDVSSSDGEDSSDEESSKEDWAKAAPWRAYYAQQGITPLRRDHSLAPELVRPFMPKKRVVPVQVQPLGGAAAGAAHAVPRPKAGGRGWRRMLACGGGRDDTR